MKELLFNFKIICSNPSPHLNLNMKNTQKSLRLFSAEKNNEDLKHPNVLTAQNYAARHNNFVKVKVHTGAASTLSKCYPHLFYGSGRKSLSATFGFIAVAITSREKTEKVQQWRQETHITATQTSCWQNKASGN